MGRWEKFRARLLSGEQDRNIAFNDLIGYLQYIGMTLRIRGSHHIFTGKQAVGVILNLQPLPDGMAKPYQVKQVRDMVKRYFSGEAND